MSRSLLISPLLIASVLILALLAGSGRLTHVSAARADVVADNYIITFKPGIGARTKANDKARAYGLTVRHVYESTITGFAAFVPPGQLKRLQNDPDVATIVEDRRVFAFTDQRPTGIRRSQADRNSTANIGSHTNPIDVDVAVIDTGIQPDHPDLNVVGGVSCVPGKPSYADENGHGTHVAGTVGALDNGTGVVGVAPGARLWAVRVLDASGQGQFSDVICGIDWVTANAATIDVVNMSLGGEAPVDSCADGSLNAAICRSVAAGVTYVVAAGNSGLDASGFVPAAYPEVITVSAIADTDGAPGGRGSSSYLYGDDDELATFSNFGSPVDIAAPGVNIYSTWPGGYSYSSGTSMASPHVAGAAAVYLHLNPGSSPASVHSYLLSIAWPQGSADGFTNDVDGYAEPLLNAGAIGGDPLPPPPPACTLSADEGTVSSSVVVNCVNFGANEFVRLHWDTTSTTHKTSIYTNIEGSGKGTFTIPDSAGGDHQIVALGASSGIQLSMPFKVNPKITTSSASGKVGAFTVVTLTGFGAGEPISLNWDDGTTAIATATGSSTGRASISLRIPESIAGQHTLTALGSQSTLTASTTYTIVPGASLSPTAGRVGTAVTVTLQGYHAAETIVVSWQDAPGTTTQIATLTASQLGSATTTFTVPEATQGAHPITGAGESGHSASASLTVSPVLALSATSGKVGAAIAVTLSGYAAHESVTFRWFDTQTAVTTIGNVVTSNRGSASFTLTIPEATNGSHRFEAVGAVVGTRYVFFAVQAGIVLNPTSGEGGDAVAAALSGYRAGETITVKWFSTTYASTVVATATASDKGSATASFTVPADATAGDHKVEATGGSSYARASSTFAVISTGPPPPTTPTCTLDAASGRVGTRLSVTCINFALSESIRIHWDTTSTTYRASIWTGATGGGTTSFYIPDSPAGPHLVIALGSTSSLRVENTFTVVPGISLSATSTKVGGFISATLKGFAANETVALTWDGLTVKTVTASATGSASAYFYAPESPRGEHAVAALGGASGLSVSTPISIIPSLALSPTAGRAGSLVTISLRGYVAGEEIAISWNDAQGLIQLAGALTASALGSASMSFTAPDAVYGNHRIDGIGSAGSSASANFRILQSFTISPTSGTVGSAVALTLTGFAASESITVQWFETSTSGATIATLNASSTGSATATITVPETAGGSHKILVTGAASGISAYQYFSVRASIALSPTSGPGGTTVTLALAGYRAGEAINVAWFTTSYQSIAVATGTAGGLGSATVSFAVPADATIGNHKVEATGQSSYARSSNTFNVTAAAEDGTTGIESVAQTVDISFSDDFSARGPGSVPPGWSIVPQSSVGISVVHSGKRVAFEAHSSASGNAWLIRDGATFNLPAVQVELRPARDSGRYGIVIAWRGPNDFVAVLANAETDQLEVVEVIGGVARTIYRGEDGSVSLARGQAYVLRVETGAGASGSWVNLFWSENGSTFEPIGGAEGLGPMAGGVGLVAAGSNGLDLTFDDFAASPSQSTGPLVVDEPQAPGPTGTSTATPAPTAEPTTEPTREPPTPEPTSTVESTSTPQPAPTDTPTATPEPQLPEPATLTPEPAPETPVESESTSSDTASDGVE